MHSPRIFALATLLVAGVANAAHPTAVANLRQQTPAGTLVAAGATITGSSIQLTAQSDDTTCDYYSSYVLEVEVRPVSSSFTGVATHTSASMSKPDCVYKTYPVITVSGLGSGAYKWRARERVGGSYCTTCVNSGWVAFNAGLTAFNVGGLQWSPAQVAFGPQRVGQTSTAMTVTFVNNDAAAVTLNAATVSGPFALGGGPTLPLTLNPTDTATFSVTASPTVLGSASGSLTVTSSVSASGHVVPLSVTGAEPQLQLASSTVAFGDVGINTTATQQVTILNGGNMALTVGGGTTSSPFGVSGLTGLVVPAGGSANFDVTYQPTAQQPDAATLTITSDAPGGPHALSLSGTGIAPKLSLDTQTISFPDTVVGQSSTAVTVTLTNTGTGTLLVGAPVLPAGFTTTLTPTGVAEGGSLQFQVAFAPNAPGNVTGTLEVPSNDAAGTKTIALSGIARAPLLAVSPSPHNYGPVTLSSSQTVVVTLTNGGDVPLTVSGLSFSGMHSADYALVAPPTLPATVAANGGILQLSVRFTPGGIGVRTGALEIQSNKYPAGVESISLTGSGQGPQIQVPSSFISFGSTNVGTTVVRNFSVTNNGNTSLTVSSLGFSGSAASEFSSSTTFPFTVAPGGAQTVSLTFQPSVGGFRSATATLSSNDPVNPGVSVYLDGTGLTPNVAVSPASLPFGKVRVGEQATQPITISNTGTGPLLVGGLQLSGSGAHRFALFGANAPFTLSAGGSVSLQVTYTPGLVGADAAQLAIASDDPDSSSVNVALTGEGIAPAISVSTTRLDFGGQLVNRTSAPRTVELHNTGSAPLTVNSLSITGTSSWSYDLIASPTPFTINTGSKKTISVTLTPSSVAEHVARLVISTDALSSPTANVNLVGLGLSTVFSVSPMNLSFPIVKSGTRGDTLTATLQNTSGDPIRLAQPSLAGANPGDFEVTLASDTVAPGETATAHVTYAPTTAGQHLAELRLVSVDTAIPAAVITLEGNAVSQVLEARPVGMDFGSVPVGERKQELIHLVNKTSRPVQLTSAISSTPEFSVDPGALTTLEPGASMNLPVIFAPAGQNFTIGTLAIATNLQAAGEAELTLPLSGTGTEPVEVSTGCSATSGSLAGGVGAMLGLLVLLRGRRRSRLHCRVHALDRPRSTRRDRRGGVRAHRLPPSVS